MPAILTPLPKDTVCNPGFWRFSPAVPLLVRPVRVTSTLPAGDTPWRQALDAIPNTDGSPGGELGYDDWFRIIAAIFAETQGSEEGLALAQAWSSRAAKHDPDFLEARVWPYLDNSRADGVTGGTIMSLAARMVGWRREIDASGFGPVDAFGRDLVAATPARAEDGDDEDLSGLGLTLTPGGAVVPRQSLEGEIDAALEEIRLGIPPAQHACTDQANANRLVREFGRLLLVCAGAWHAWDGRRWARDEGEVYRMACQLGNLVAEESKRLRKRAKADLDAGKINAIQFAEAEKAAKALDGWSRQSEMKGSIEAAVRLAQKMLAVNPATIDRNPYLVNVANGTLDLRTGELRPWRQDDRITRIIEVKYRPGARSPAWERILRDVTCENAPLIAFLRRWFGYCLTGSVREQKFAVLWGSGGNGKSLIVGAIDSVMGEYAGLAAAGLLTDNGKAQGVHSSAVAALVGKRLVTAHETGEGNLLSEAFVKRATGTDNIDARFLYGEQFSFVPTHKIQLLTNYKPTIKGQDRGIWRRVLLVPFLASFGSPEDVAAGRAQRVGDPLLADYLKRAEEREAVLAWLVEGAKEWYAQGLREPDVVRAAVAGYQIEQDRVGQFVAECCEIGQGDDYWAPLSSSGMHAGLYPAFQAWCKEAGVFPMSKPRFRDELERAVPGLKMHPARTSVAEGRAKITRVVGLRLAPVED